jgi:GNAT superfamily N-acetyltransferase
MEIRWAEERDLDTLALFRWQWGAERQVPTEEFESFRLRFLDWCGNQASSHRALVGVVDDEAVGMAWLARVARLPDADGPADLQVDLQSVYIVADRRGAGLGSLLVDAAFEAARAMGASLMTVHAGRRSLPLYKRLGFEPSGRLLQIQLCR